MDSTHSDSTDYDSEVRFALPAMPGLCGLIRGDAHSHAFASQKFSRHLADVPH